MELVLTLPFVLLLVFFLIEVGRIGFAFQGAKAAAMAGVHACATYHSVEAGRILMTNKLAVTGLEITSASIRQVPNRHAYQASVVVRYYPFFADFSMPTLSGPVRLFPASFNISYSAVEDTAVY